MFQSICKNVSSAKRVWKNTIGLLCNNKKNITKEKTVRIKRIWIEKRKRSLPFVDHIYEVQTLYFIPWSAIKEPFSIVLTPYAVNTTIMEFIHYLETKLSKNHKVELCMTMHEDGSILNISGFNKTLVNFKYVESLFFTILWFFVWILVMMKKLRILQYHIAFINDYYTIQSSTPLYEDIYTYKNHFPCICGCKKTYCITRIVGDPLQKVSGKVEIYSIFSKEVCIITAEDMWFNYRVFWWMIIFVNVWSLFFGLLLLLFVYYHP
jgi:hypothetical protein